ncbi:MAG: phage terminase large subunit [Proteobacteria bacterium]|nr:phage terminase large subunit [Pseudomonadota bacterium]MBU1740690.1 phage terminase large subunit [Pseudomonadota bacterium]
MMTLDGQGRWFRAPHLDRLCLAMQDAAKSRNKRTIVCLPPRHGKSQVVSKKFPAWYLGQDPDREIIITSYSLALARDHSRVARETFRRWGPILFGLDLATDMRAADRWGVADHGGGCTAAGVAGPITGRGADVLIIDDPVKNRQEAESRTVRDRIWDWYRSTARTRLAPGGSVVVVMTRWHEDDLVGRLLAQGAEPWTVLCFPAQAEENDPLGRSPGEALFPARYPLPELLRIKADLGTYEWQALYQQSPRPAGGALFKAEHFVDFEVEGDLYRIHRPSGTISVARDRCWLFATCDPAGRTDARADFFVLATWAVTPETDLLLVSLVRTRLEGPDQPRLITREFGRHGHRFIGIETKNIGLGTFQQLKRDGLPVRELKADADKFTRALPAAARYEAGQVFHLRGAPWRDELEDELTAFPGGRHDDQVDVVAYAALVLSELKMARAGDIQTSGVKLAARHKSGAFLT